jgi:hypothetical protein
VKSFRERLQGWLTPVGEPELSIDEDARTLTVPGESGGAPYCFGLADLQRVAVVSQRRGPLLLSIAWVLTTASQEVRLPLDAEEAETLVRLLQTLPGFDTDALSRAVSATAPTLIVCWQRGPESGPGEETP